MPLSELFSKLLKINPTAGVFIAGGLIVLTAAAVVSTFGVAMDALVRVALVVVAFSVAMVILTRLSGTAVTVIGWSLTLVFLFWLFAGTAQTFASGRIQWLPSVQCIWFPISESCFAVRSTEIAVVSESNSATDGSDVVGDANETESGAQFGSVDRVYVQFAGSLERQDIVKFSEKLLDSDWPIQGAERGGERTGKAAGLNEIRYYHEDQREAAEALASQVNEISPAQKPVLVRDMSGTALATENTAGLLEIWISN